MRPWQAVAFVSMFLSLSYFSFVFTQCLLYFNETFRFVGSFACPALATCQQVCVWLLPAALGISLRGNRRALHGARSHVHVAMRMPVPCRHAAVPTCQSPVQFTTRCQRSQGPAGLFDCLKLERLVMHMTGLLPLLSYGQGIGAT